MPVRRDKRTGAWIFQSTIKLADGASKRVFGTPGVPGPYHDLPRSKVGAREAERRAVSEVMNGKPDVTAPVTEEAPPAKTIKEHSETFVETYKPGSKPSEKREKRRVLNTHLLPIFGHRTIESLMQSDVDTYAKSELDRGMAIKSVNNQLAVLSTLIKYVTGVKSRLRFKLEGMAGEFHAVASADVEKLLEKCEDTRYEAVILLASEAGLRAAEIRGLQWNDIKSEQITVRRSLDKMTNEAVAPKHNKSRTIPMSKRLAASLASLPRRSLWVVSEPDRSCVTYDRMLETVHAIYVRAGVARPPKALHCLRHTFGTVMARKVPTLRYVDVNEDDKREAIAAVFGAPESVVQARCKQEGSAEPDSALTS